MGWRRHLRHQLDEVCAALGLDPEEWDREADAAMLEPAQPVVPAQREVPPPDLMRGAK